MARYTDAELSEIKQSVDLVALIQSRGITLAKHGSKDLKGLCPLHPDKNPSLIVSPNKNLWNCPACGKGGDVIKFVELHDGVSFRHAVELLKNGHVIESSDRVKKATIPKLPPPVELNVDDHKQLIRIIDYYHERLLETRPAQDYLEKRGIFSAEAVKTFKIGYADRTLGLRLPHKNRSNGKVIRDQLEKIGLYRKTGREHLNGCLVIPVIDENGLITEVYGRKLNDANRNRGCASHLYLPGPHKGIWNPACLSSKEIILCESLIDALTFWGHGFRNVTASYGSDGFTSDHLAAFIDHRIETVFIAYDRDNAGDAGAAKVAERLTGEGIRSRRVQFPRGMDANAYALSVKPADRSFRVLLESAEWMEDLQPPTISNHHNEPELPDDNETEPQSQQPISKPETVPEPATGKPAAGKLAIPCTFNGEDIEISLGERRYRVRGLARNNSYDILKVNLRVGKEDFFHFDTLDLYNARHRKAFIHAASDELKVEPDTIKRDIGRVLLKLEELQEQNLIEALEVDKPEVVELEDAEKVEALELLKSPQLLDRIAADFEACGLVGERANSLVAYLVAVSRLTDDPLAVIIQSSSSAGKSSLLDAVLAFMPEEDQVKYSAMTGQSLFYMGETELQHKILAISEEEGAEQAGYALKILQSEKRLRIASTGKDPKTGRLVTQEYVVEGPSSMFLTTTAAEIDEELQNRCIVLTVNENPEQTQRIHHLQRQSRTLSGVLCGEDKKHLQRIHRNAQRLLKPVLVVNPFAEQLTFSSRSLRTRRDHVKYLNLINAIALLHQYQRPLRTVMHKGKRLSYIEVTLKDIDNANELAREVMGVSLDELPPQTRKLLLMLENLAEQRCQAEEIELRDLRLNRREIRESTGWSDTQLRVHLARLVEMEYLMAHRSGRGGRYAYEVIYSGEGKQSQRCLMQLINTDKLTSSEPACSEQVEESQDRENHDYDAKVAGLSDKVAEQEDKVARKSLADRRLVAGKSRSEKSDVTDSKPINNDRNDTKLAGISKDHIAGPSKTESSYTHDNRSNNTANDDIEASS